MRNNLSKYYLNNEKELKALRRGDIVNMVLDIDKSFNNFSKEELSNLIMNINEINNDIIEDNQELVEQLYNIIALDFFTDLLYKKINQVDYHMEFKKFCSDDFNLKLFKILKDKAPLTQKELARELHMTPNALSNRLSRLDNTDFIYKYQIPSNKKNIYYTLKDEYKDLIIEENIVNQPNIINNRNRLRTYSFGRNRNVAPILAFAMKGQDKEYEFRRVNKQSKYR